MTMIETELRKWKRNKIVWGILALTILLAVFAINRACSISRSSPYMDSFGDLYTLYSELPKGVQEKTSAKAMQADWSEEIEKVGGLPEDAVPDISCYVPEKSEQNRVEFVIPCEKGDFKVFINYSADGSLYNYVIWKNNAL